MVTSGGGVFEITSPTDDPTSLDTNTNMTITVTTPPGVTDVQFACTLGAWDGGAESVVEKPVAGGTASAVFRSADAGVATIQVSDADDAGTTDSMSIIVSAPSSEASQIALQASAYVVAPSIGGVYNSVTLEATVRNVSDDPVGGAPVSFTIPNLRTIPARDPVPARQPA